MPRKKERYFSVEMLEEDSLREHYNPFLNFICKESNLSDSFYECDVRDVLKEKNNEDDLKTILKKPDNKPIVFIGENMLLISEISLNKTPKESDKYLYRIYDYNENKWCFCTFNEVLSYLNKKIKTKYAFTYYNGTNERIEFSEKDAANIVTRMTPGTHNICFSQINGRGEESEAILIVPFKIM